MMTTNTLSKLSAALAALAAWAAPAAADVDPAIVGYWELQKPGVINPSRTLVEFHADGAYEIHDAVMVQTGTYEAEDGEFSLTSRSGAAWRDRGGYTLSADGDELTLSGLAGAATWSRVEPYFSSVEIDGQQIPQNIGAVLALAWVEEARSRPGLEDSVPVSDIEVDQDRTGEFAVTMRFLSPTTGKGATVTVREFERSLFVHNNGVSWSDAVVPLWFVDLPEVAALMKSEGVDGPFTRFVLSENRTQWGWSAVGSRARHDVTWITADGQVSHEENSEYVEQYNADWERAAQAIASVMRGPADQSGAYGCAQGDEVCIFHRSMSATMCTLADPDDFAMCHGRPF